MEVLVGVTNESKEMDRVYFKVLDGSSSISVYYRPNHSFFASIDREGNWQEQITNLLDMPMEQFYIELLAKGIKPPKDVTQIGTNATEEEWYKKAWLFTTKKILRDLGRESVPQESIPFEFIANQKKSDEKAHFYS